MLKLGKNTINYEYRWCVRCAYAPYGYFIKIREIREILLNP
jgi:hypothetical protein